MTNPKRMSWAAGWLVVLAVGCGTQNADMAPVQGTVTYKGQPLPNALVVFMPETANKLPATGLTDANGKYELMTTVMGDGVAIGKHRVTVTAREEEQGLAEGQLPVDAQGAAKEPAARIPTRYFSPDSSGLSADVPAGGTTVNFELTE